MSGFDPEHLSWLEPAPADLRRRLKGLDSVPPREAADTLRRLGVTAMDVDQLAQFTRALDRTGAALQTLALSPARLALLMDGTTDYIAPAIRASSVRHGVLAEVYTPPYGQAMQEVMDPGSGLAAFRPEIALIASDHRSLGLATVSMDPAAADTAVEASLARVAALADGLERRGAGVMLATVPVPPEPWCGHFDRRAPGSVAAQVTAFNAGLVRLADARAATLFDAAALADLVGRGRWFDHAYWQRAKLPFAMDLVPLYADHVARLLGALRGRARKCLVLDLDNTLWGGVIGDDGLEGIRLGQGSAQGEAHLAVQHHALALKARGVILAVASKNEHETALLPFRAHPEMALREQDIAVFVANWTDKASNLEHIARLLNIGTDALVFLDDNPAERARVRQMLPEVAVPELAEDPAYYPAALAHAGYFETVGLSADDTRRAEQYRANASRAAAMEVIGDYEAYLASLEMVCDIRPFDAVGRTRIAQLINKTNQFNLTTRRYTEAQVAAMETDPQIFALQARLADRFGDNGMISVVIFRKGPEEWLCDSWLMSCRVLGRRVEEALLAAAAEAARAAGAERLVGEYHPTKKNPMVADLFARLGFAAAGPAGPDGTRWRLALSEYAAPDLPMRLTGAAVPAAPARASA